MASDLGPFEVGQILALHREGYSHRQIAERVTRGRSSPGPSLCAIGVAVRHLDVDPSWTGQRKRGSGSKCKTTASEDKKIVRAAKRQRGKRAINSAKLRGLLPAARRVSHVAECHAKPIEIIDAADFVSSWGLPSFSPPTARALLVALLKI